MNNEITWRTFIYYSIRGLGFDLAILFFNIYSWILKRRLSLLKARCKALQEELDE